MGSGEWSKRAYEDVREKRSKESYDDTFKQNRERKVHAELDPKNIDLRESRDSVEHPNSLAVIVGLDVTGSMGKIPENMIKNKLGALMNTLVENGIPDPQILFSAVGDHISDSAPLQVSQFESGTKEIDSQLEKIYIEGGGGPGGMESYPLIWLFAAKSTSIDCFEKRGEKGFIFTIGDEGYHPLMEARYLKTKTGFTLQEDVHVKTLFDEVQRTYHVFHIHVEEGQNAGRTGCVDQWHDLIGQNLLILKDQNAIAELIATTVSLVQGMHIDAVTADFDERTKSSVSSALVNFRGSMQKRSSGETGIVAL